MARTKQMRRGRKKPAQVKPTHVTDSSPDDRIGKFIQICQEIDNSSDMKTILDKKVMKHYSNANPGYKNSLHFKQFVEELISKMSNDRNNVYVYITQITTELKARKGSLEAQLGEPPSKKRKASEGIDYESLKEARDQIKIKKLSKALEKLQKKIKELETVEVNWDDEDDSAYIMLQRYKARAVKVFDKLCEYTKESRAAGKVTKIHFSGTPYPQVNKAIEKFINETGNFPDYPDMHSLIVKVNTEENGKYTEKEVEEMARLAFEHIGKEIQRRRRHETGESLLVFIEGQMDDPADTNKEIQEELLANKKYWGKIDEVIDEFANKAKEKEESIDPKEEEESCDEETEDESDDKSNADIEEDLSDLSGSDTDEKKPSALEGSELEAGPSCAIQEEKAPPESSD